MKVDETLAVCKVLAAHGYGAYELTNDCGYNAMTCYPNDINDDRKFINMEGSETDNFEERGDLQTICDEISEALNGGAENGSD